MVPTNGKGMVMDVGDAKLRKGTKFVVCANHELTFAGECRRRMAAIFVEGGPGYSNHCDGIGCYLYPGLDLFNPSTVAIRSKWIVSQDWYVNRPDVIAWRNEMLDDLREHIDTHGCTNRCADYRALLDEWYQREPRG